MLTVAIPTAEVSRTVGSADRYPLRLPGRSLCKIGDLGREIVVKNTIWTEYATAREEITS
jgi:hypothetical protein